MIRTDYQLIEKFVSKKKKPRLRQELSLVPVFFQMLKDFLVRFFLLNLLFVIDKIIIRIIRRIVSIVKAIVILFVAAVVIPMPVIKENRGGRKF